MLLTEAEAKEKWCPLARVVEIDHEGEPIQGWPVGNRASQAQYAHPHARCIGSACMAWRAIAEKEYAEGSTFTVHKRGYCGAFGLPYGVNAP